MDVCPPPHCIRSCGPIYFHSSSCVDVDPCFNHTVLGNAAPHHLKKIFFSIVFHGCSMLCQYGNAMLHESGYSTNSDTLRYINTVNLKKQSSDTTRYVNTTTQSMKLPSLRDTGKGQMYAQTYY